MSPSNDDEHGQEVAVIGLSCRFPGAPNSRALWRNLRDGVESLTRLTDEELAASGVPQETRRNPNYVNVVPLLEDVEQFAASFFNYAPREAAIMDPQHRLFLECCWEALEDAGYGGGSEQESIGVFAGAGNSDYLVENLAPNRETLPPLNGLEVILGNDRDHLCTRVSYNLNLRGPSVSVQTACSTSLVAVHMACDSLLSGQCDMALAGAASVNLPQKKGYLFREGGIASPDGHTYAFDARGKGTVFGSGVGVVTLKRLADALRDGDNVRAVVKGSAINNDGSAKVAYSAPSVEGQANVIAEALEVANVHPETISYIEAHGTGTELGDPVEISALAKAYRLKTEKSGYCAIGTIKTNIGHTVAAAGIAGFIKTVLSLEHEQLPPSLNYESPNPNIDFERTPFFVNTKLRPWESESGPRRAGVSSFGMGGTNAHVILEQAPRQEPNSSPRSSRLLLLSAKTEAALQHAARNLADRLDAAPNADLADVAYTLHAGRKAFPRRAACVASDLAEAASGLRGSFLIGTAPGDREVAFMFSGQGAQYPNMGRGLYETESVFRDAVDLCAARVKSRTGLDLLAALYPDPSREEWAGAQLRQTGVTQPALFAVEYALARLWMSRGVQPAALIGHSIGEYVAACLAGVFTLENAVDLVADRGRFMQELPAGSMLAVMRPEDEVAPRLNGELSLAAVNAPQLSVVSGPAEAVEAFRERLASEQIQCRPLHTSHAFHSSMMDPILEPFSAKVAEASPQPPALPLISNLTGDWMTAAEAQDPGYWSRHLRGTVRFADGLRTLLNRNNPVLLEVGPGNALTTFARNHPAASESTAASSLRHPKENISDDKYLLRAAGSLWTAGVNLDPDKLYAGESRRRTPLPTYPFERRRCWIDPPGQGAAKLIGSSKTESLEAFEDWFYIPSWKETSPAARVETFEGETWLLFDDNEDAGRALAEEVERRGGVVVRARSGEAYKKVSDREYVVVPTLSQHYADCLSDLASRDSSPSVIAHLWTCPDRAFELGSTEFDALHALARALGDRPGAGATSLGIVTSRLFDVVPGDTPTAERSLLIGPARVIPAEVSGVSCTLVDIGGDSEGGVAERVARAADEIASVRQGSSLCALRGGRRWIPQYERIPAPSADAATFRAGGVYLITGGLKGIGLAIAQHLAENHQAKLVLTGRLSLPPRSEWESLLRDEAGDARTRERVRIVLDLEEQGAEVEAVGADATDEAAMGAVFELLDRRFGRLDGVIHSAGVPSAGLMQLKNAGTAHEVLAPKVIGARVLDPLVAERKPDFFVLCSSMTAILGGLGQADYCSANAYLDAFAAEFRARTGIPTVSIAWDAWKDTGMAVDTELPAGLEHMKDLRLGIPTRQGLEAFTRIVAAPYSQVAVSTRDFRTGSPKTSTPASSSGAASRSEERVAPTRSDSSASLPAPTPPTSAPTRPREEVERVLLEVWQKLLGMESVGVHTNFFDLGGHSLLAVELFDEIEKRLGKRLPALVLYEAPTVSKLAELLEPRTASPETTDSRESHGEVSPKAGDETPSDRAGEPLWRGLSKRLLQIVAMYAPGRTTLRARLHRMRGVKMGEKVSIGFGSIIETKYPEFVSIADGAVIGIGVLVIAHFLETTQEAKRDRQPTVHIGERAFIGPGSIILPNVTIGRGAVVAAGSVVSESVPPHTIVRGNPAKPVGRFEAPLTENTLAERLQS